MNCKLEVMRNIFESWLALSQTKKILFCILHSSSVVLDQKIYLVHDNRIMKFDLNQKLIIITDVDDEFIGPLLILSELNSSLNISITTHQYIL